MLAIFIQDIFVPAHYIAYEARTILSLGHLVPAVHLQYYLGEPCCT